MTEMRIRGPSHILKALALHIEDKFDASITHIVSGEICATCKNFDGMKAYIKAYCDGSGATWVEIRKFEGIRIASCRG